VPVARVVGWLIRLVRFQRNGAVASRPTHGPPEDLLDDWGQLRVPVAFPPEGDIAEIPTTRRCSGYRTSSSRSRTLSRIASGGVAPSTRAARAREIFVPAHSLTVSTSSLPSSKVSSTS
jgi:hypothetical protein